MLPNFRALGDLMILCSSNLLILNSLLSLFAKWSALVMLSILASTKVFSYLLCTLSTTSITGELLESFATLLNSCEIWVSIADTLLFISSNSLFGILTNSSVFFVLSVEVVWKFLKKYELADLREFVTLFIAFLGISELIFRLFSEIAFLILAFGDSSCWPILGLRRRFLPSDDVLHRLSNWGVTSWFNISFSDSFIFC